MSLDVREDLANIDEVGAYVGGSRTKATVSVRRTNHPEVSSTGRQESHQALGFGPLVAEPVPAARPSVTVAVLHASAYRLAQVARLTIVPAKGTRR